MTESNAAIELSNLQFRFTGAIAPLLRISSLRIDPQEKIFLHGPSGSGKSTLLGLITGVLQPQQGTLQVLGKDLNRMSSGERDAFRGSEIGYIFQQFNLIPYLSVRENIGLPCRLHGARKAALAGARIEEEVNRLAAHLGLTSLLDRRVTQLSTGQQQRVAIARAVIGKPRLIVADEPTSALDTDRRDAFLDLLFESTQDAGSTLVFVSHDRPLAARFSREISLAAVNEADRI